MVYCFQMIRVLLIMSKCIEDRLVGKSKIETVSKNPEPVNVRT